MATKIYEQSKLTLIDNTEITLMPIKLKYLREFMDCFEKLKTSKTDDEALDVLIECVAISMKDFYPSIATIEAVSDLCDLSMIYTIVEQAGGIKLRKDKNDQESVEAIKDQAKEGGLWSDFDLAKLEAEVFLTGIWKNYDELESSLSLPELTKTLEIKRELDYQDKKFAAAVQGVDLDSASGKTKEDPWEKMKAKVFSNNGTDDPNDILAFQGVNAQKAGFGIGIGLNYTKLD